MDKKLKAYAEYIEKEHKTAKKASAELIEYHLQMVQHFQHERLIHLIVTMFFALFLMLFFGLFLALALCLPSYNASNWLLIGVGAITLILLITTLFYAAHYYKLENGTQRLEDMTRRLYGRDFWRKK